MKRDECLPKIYSVRPEQFKLELLVCFCTQERSCCELPFKMTKTENDCG